MKLNVGAQATIAACLSKWMPKSGAKLFDFQVMLDSLFQDSLLFHSCLIR